MTNDERDDLLLKISKQLVVIEAGCVPCRATVAEHHRALDGANGDAGLKSRLKVLEERVIETCNKVGWLQVVAWSSVTGGFLIALGVIGWLVEKWVK
jgi:hypothetical protein